MYAWYLCVLLLLIKTNIHKLICNNINSIELLIQNYVYCYYHSILRKYLLKCLYFIQKIIWFNIKMIGNTLFVKVDKNFFSSWNVLNFCNITLFIFNGILIELKKYLLNELNDAKLFSKLNEYSIFYKISFNWIFSKFCLNIKYVLAINIMVSSMNLRCLTF